jgi:hypothetical protein
MKKQLHHVGILPIAVALLLACAIEMGTAQDFVVSQSGAEVFKVGGNGNVGIGVTNPGKRLEVFAATSADGIRVSGSTTAPARNPAFFLNQQTTELGTLGLAQQTGAFSTDATIGDVVLRSLSGRLFLQNGINNSALAISGNRVGIGTGTTTPDAKLEVKANQTFALLVNNTSSGAGIGASIQTAGTVPSLHIYNSGTGDLISASTAAGEGLRVLNNGTTVTKVLQITGGSDLAEPFEFSDTESLPPGSVVIIDDENPGRLKLSNTPYDKRVAGVLSGAGGIRPGVTLRQEGISDRGQDVALNGRVYVFASASNGAIVPGDLLTTSEIPGHAMKATDRSLSHGTVIGKAMSRLESGEGLVLVLVNLQ